MLKINGQIVEFFSASFSGIFIFLAIVVLIGMT